MPAILHVRSALPKLAKLASIVLIPAALAASLAGCGQQPQRQAKAVAVDVALAERRDVPIKLEAVGGVEPLQSVEIRAQVSGYLSAVLFQEGQDVRQGQALLRIDDREYAAARMQAQAELDQAQAQADNAEQELRRSRQLFEKQYISQQELDNAQVAFDSLAAQARAKQAALRRAELDLNNCAIRAPIAGRAGALLAHQGDLVQADATLLLTINQIDPISVRFSIPEIRLLEVRAALAAGEVAVQAAPAGEANQPLRGRLTFVDNAVDAATGSIVLKAEYSNPAGLLWPGQFVNVTLLLGVTSDALVVPAQAVQTGQQGRFVFVVTAENKAELRQVALEREQGGLAIVTQGIEPGEAVVIDGQTLLSPGAAVELRNAPGQGDEKAE